jgi:HK97 gp10 family phage protein
MGCVMTDSVSFDIKGLDVLLGRLQAVSHDVKRKGGRAALRKAAQQVAENAKANALRIDDPRTAAAIYQNIALRWNGKRFKRTGDLAFRIGVLGGARIPKSKPKGAEPGGPGGDTRYWAFVEFGTEGKAAQPFMRPALAGRIAAVTDTFVTNYDKALQRAIRRAARQAARG